MKTETTTEQTTWVVTRRGKMSHIEASFDGTTSITACGQTLQTDLRRERPITRFHCSKCVKAN